MKKFLSIALCAAAVSAFAASTEAVLGQVGVTKIDSGLKNTIVAVSYDDLAGGSGMVVSNLVKTTNLTVGDQLAIFNNGEYTTWTLRQNGTDGPKYWEKNEKAFKVGADGKLTVESGEAASDVTQVVGTGIWLIRQNPTKNGNAVPFYIYGKPSTAKTVSTKSNAWNLVGNPGQSAVPITREIIQASNNDEMLVPAKEGLVTYIYKENAKDDKGDKGAWCRAAGADGVLGGAPTIEGGKGFWIMTAKAVDIKW